MDTAHDWEIIAESVNVLKQCRLCGAEVMYGFGKSMKEHFLLGYGPGREAARYPMPLCPKTCEETSSFFDEMEVEAVMGF